MGRIEGSFKALRASGAKGFIPFITAGDPDLDTTEEIVVELSEAGATVIELGVPFSDPMADGPVIQRASERALKHAFELRDVLATATRVRKRIATPIILFSYFNPLFQFGVQQLAQQASDSGIDGILVTDLTPEEADDFGAAMGAKGIDMIFLVAPTSTDERLKLISTKASGFIYAVSRAGVTGTRETLSVEAEHLVSRVRIFSDLPIAVGFGISTREQVADVQKYADAVVVGSAIVKEVERLTGEPRIPQRIGDFARSLLSTKSLPA